MGYPSRHPVSPIDAIRSFSIFDPQPRLMVSDGSTVASVANLAS